MGTTIFERRPNRIKLTAFGEQIVQQAQRVLDEAEHIKVLAAQGKDQLNGRLRFGVIATVGPYIPRIWRPLPHTRAPKMPLELEETLTQNLVGMLKSGKLEVIIIALLLEEPGLHTTALYDEPFQA